MNLPNEGLKESLAWHYNDECRNLVPTNKVGSLEGKQRGLSQRGKIFGCV